MGTHRAQVNILSEKIQFVIHEQSDHMDLDSYIEEQVNGWLECYADKLDIKNIEILYRNQIINKTLH